MNLPDNIDKVRAEISKCGKNMKRTNNVIEISSFSITLGYMDNVSSGYSWTNCITREDITDVTD